jgi:hypothetical protein
VLAAIAILAGGGSVLARKAREESARRSVQARADSARRADSVRLADSARADSARAQLVGGMVDSAALLQQRRQDSLNEAARVLTTGVMAAIRRYTNAIQRGDFAAARAAFPNMPEREQQIWERALTQYNLRFLVEPPRRVALSSNDSVADVDVVVSVQYIDRATKQTTSTPKRTRHATLVRRPNGWELSAFSAQ